MDFYKMGCFDTSCPDDCCVYFSAAILDFSINED